MILNTYFLVLTYALNTANNLTDVDIAYEWFPYVVPDYVYTG